MKKNPMTSEVSRRGLALLFAGVALVAAVSCGGGGDSPPPPANSPPPAGSPPPAPGTAPGGLYVGYYAEDPATNPEDPTLGVLHLNLPSADAAFAGQMFFTYVGCQDRNVGAISGDRAGDSLTGNWSGEIDAQLTTGAYAGEFDAARGGFAGTYTVNGGPIERTIANCIDYIIGPNGTWELFPAGTSSPASFVLTVAGTTVNWASPAGALITLVAVIDEAQALQGQGGATVFQTIEDGSLESFDLTTVDGLVLVPGTRYVVTVAAANDAQRLATGSAVVVVP